MNNSLKAFAMIAMLITSMSYGIPDVAYAGPKPEQGEAQPQAAVVNINTASVDQLQDIRGVGPAIAERIVQYRQEHGRFEKVDDLVNVVGIGEAKFEKMKAQISI